MISDIYIYIYREKSVYMTKQTLVTNIKLQKRVMYKEIKENYHAKGRILSSVELMSETYCTRGLYG